MKTTQDITKIPPQEQLAYTVTDLGDRLQVEFPESNLQANQTEYVIVEAVAAYVRARGCWPTRLTVNPARYHDARLTIAVAGIQVVSDAGTPVNVVVVGMEATE